MYLIGNGVILTSGDDNRLINDGAILIDGECIREVGDTQELKTRYPEAEYIEAWHRLVMPGFLNTHMHLYSTFSRGMALKGEPAKSFKEILEKLWFKLDRCLDTEEDIYYSAMVPLIEGIKCGTTGIIDHHASFGLVDGSLDILERAAEDAGVRSVLCYETSDRWGKDLSDASIRENVRFIKKKKDMNDLIKGTFGLHASLTLSDETLTRCRTEAETLGTGFHVHVAEGIEDVEDSMGKSGMRVVERLNSFGILGEKTLAVHCVHVDDSDIEILKNTGTMVIHNPESNMNNGVGAAPLLEFFKRGILTGIGTDGYTPSMLESVKTAYILPKLVYRDPRVGFEESRRMLFENNRKIFGRFYDRPVGVIEPGAYADIIILDYYPPTPLDANNYFGHVIFGMRDNQVNTTIVNGRILMRNHELTEIDEEKVMAKSQEVAKKFWEKMANA
ncbi:MAG: putative aminohydrolase SsnA [Thermoanaerobacteraceae bacterium]|nr:putative aminohydrolase SsnA [Thermoanaerobacteraceae bacterium]